MANCLPNLTLSILVPYRDREVTRLERCLNSLPGAGLLREEMEVIVLDYGSRSAYRDAAQELCEGLGFPQYYYTETEGWFWSRSQALNTALDLAQGEYVLVLDVDLILVKGLLSHLISQAQPRIYWVYKYVYLPKRFNDYGALAANPAQFQTQLPHSQNTALGTILAPREAFVKAGKYDALYCIWGKEDLDLGKRLDSLPLIRKELSEPQYFSFHQWHPHAQGQFPGGWLEVLKRWESSKEEIKAVFHRDGAGKRDRAQVLSITDRPVLKLVREGGYTQGKKLTWFAPWLYAAMEWTREFQNLPPGAWVYGRFQNPQPLLRIPQWRKFFKKQVEGILAHWQLKVLKREDDMLHVQAFWYLRDFLCYFILTQDKDLKDYYLHVDAEEIFFVLMKR